jgi:hypothetical protein
MLAGMVPSRRENEKNGAVLAGTLRWPCTKCREEEIRVSPSRQGRCESLPGRMRCCDAGAHSNHFYGNPGYSDAINSSLCIVAIG